MSAYEMEREARVARNNVYLEVIYRPVAVCDRCLLLDCAVISIALPSARSRQYRRQDLPQQLHESFGIVVLYTTMKPRYTSLSLDHPCRVRLAPHVGRRDLSVHIYILTPCAPATCTSTKVIFNVRYSFCSIQFSSFLHHSSRPTGGSHSCREDSGDDDTANIEILERQEAY